ncbi:addiction module toxin, HicA family [Aphanothece hegewaldii CCALA 016]|uniref:Addiction module toxin, HicA family n=1 Tax=Aphanothece hegewaldii CCALA 016 TaxID=2107694 RepID=A0A2T1LQU1_9CHRO|nr:type II toxin-antitoxin system HicA family toxin [Aphanothece hegewaldii]PSF30017.1 addiction module toxin, HicA family [Aphanothece hegewaldii CCALA 016]
MKVKQILYLLKAEGWYVSRFRGSHRQLKNASIAGTVTVSGHLSRDIHPKILGRICQQANLKKINYDYSP